MSGLLSNLCYYVAAQVGVPTMVWGGSGVAKTALTEQCAKKAGRWFYGFLPTHHLPEELSGIPVVYREENHVKMLALDWMQRFTQPGGWWMVDEYNTGPAMMRALLLSAIHEKRIGTIRLHPDLIITAACNPPEIAPNAAPLEGSVANRFVHLNWETPRESFLSGIEDDDFPVPEMPVITPACKMAEANWGRRIKMYLESMPDHLETHDPNSEEKSFASLRTWRYLRKCLAGLDEVGADSRHYKDMAAGCVGKTVGSSFLHFSSGLDLYPAGEILNGTQKVDYSKPVDVLIRLPSALYFHASRMKSSNELLPEHLDRGIEVLLTLGESGMVDAVKNPLPQLALLLADTGYRLPKNLGVRFGTLLGQIMPKA